MLQLGWDAWVKPDGLWFGEGERGEGREKVDHTISHGYHISI